MNRVFRRNVSPPFVADGYPCIRPIINAGRPTAPANGLFRMEANGSQNDRAANAKDPKHTAKMTGRRNG
jgi:hypothetical protein